MSIFLAIKFHPISVKLLKGIQMFHQHAIKVHQIEKMLYFLVRMPRGRYNKVSNGQTMLSE
jgi:hypothetical protein